MTMTLGELIAKAKARHGDNIDGIIIKVIGNSEVKVGKAETGINHSLFAGSQKKAVVYLVPEAITIIRE